ncbi:hypothetical protein GRI75_01100 [Altererythrobacter soli]|uniref:Cysteine biosynthesis protein n=1 Tax=Croceibacterium soli TaxID=1739690 RepID=A0A6I4UMM5_9SPHN|nr:EI24 domain-containing protein [Croceibacterium soli]MXP40240.1 hypothetical protein [Croceibacterium soli]
MTSLPTSLLRAAGQLTEPPVLRVIAKSVALTLAIFVTLGIAMGFGLDAAFDAAGFGRDYGLSGLLAVVLTVIGAWLLFRIVALAVLQFFADEIVEAVEGKCYPEAAAAARKLPLAEELSNSLRGALRALVANLAALPFALMLLFTGIGPALLFWAVNAWLLGRELTDMVWLRHRPSASANLAPVAPAERFLLGGAIAALLAVPFVNLLAPVLGAAAATHLVHRRLGTVHAT